MGPAGLRRSGSGGAGPVIRRARVPRHVDRVSDEVLGVPFEGDRALIAEEHARGPRPGDAHPEVPPACRLALTWKDGDRATGDGEDGWRWRERVEPGERGRDRTDPVEWLERRCHGATVLLQRRRRVVEDISLRRRP